MEDKTNEINLDNVAKELDIKDGKAKEPEPKIAQSPVLEKAVNEKKKDAIVEEKETVQDKPVVAGIEDIFSDTEKKKPAVLQPKKESDTPQEEEVKPKGNLKKMIALAVVLLMVGAIVAGAYFGYDYYVSNDGKLPFLSNEETEEAENEETPIVQKEEPEVEKGVINQIPQNEEKKSSPPRREDSNVITGEDDLDTDGDGLPDKDELVRGMNIESNDSDSDGLFDREEVMVYNTDPTNPDTDGDGFLDGDEVNGGYNPKGTGMLYDIRGSN